MDCKVHTRKDPRHKVESNLPYADVVTRCGTHLLTGYNNNDFTVLASFTIPLDDYTKLGSAEFTTVMTVRIMHFITLNSKPDRTFLKIVAQVRSNLTDVIVSFRWLTKTARLELKKVCPAVVELCWVCRQNKPATDFKRCSICRESSYCSIACQKKAWPEHKKTCHS